MIQRNVVVICDNCSHEIEIDEEDVLKYEGPILEVTSEKSSKVTHYCKECIEEGILVKSSHVRFLKYSDITELEE